MWMYVVNQLKQTEIWMTHMGSRILGSILNSLEVTDNQESQGPRGPGQNQKAGVYY
jgi:hypothetical protein